MEQITQNLPVAQRAKNALAVTPEYEKQLVELAGKHAAITAITNEAGRQDCHSARMELKTKRLVIEKAGKAAREDAQAFAKAVIAEEKRLLGIIAPEEQRLQALQDGYEAQKEAERRRAEQAEAERKSAIMKRQLALEILPARVAGGTSAQIAAALEGLRAEPPEGWAQEFLPQVKQVYQSAEMRLAQMHQAALAAEAEAKRQAEERARLEAEQKRLDEERRRIAAEEDAARKRIAAEEEQARRARQAEEDRIRAEREHVEQLRRAAEESERKKRQEEEDRQRAERRRQDEAEAAERARQRAEQEKREADERARLAAEHERMDARGALESFVERFGHLEEFGFVVVAIRTYFEKQKKAA